MHHICTCCLDWALNMHHICTCCLDWALNMHHICTCCLDWALNMPDGELKLGPFLLIWINFIPVWICNHNHYKMWYEITYPFPNLNGAAVEVGQWWLQLIFYWTYDYLPIMGLKLIHVNEIGCYIQGFQINDGAHFLWHDDVIKWKHFRFTGPLCGEFINATECHRNSLIGSQYWFR